MLKLFTFALGMYRLLNKYWVQRVSHMPSNLFGFLFLTVPTTETKKSIRATYYVMLVFTYTETITRPDDHFFNKFTIIKLCTVDKLFL